VAGWGRLCLVPVAPLAGCEFLGGLVFLARRPPQAFLSSLANSTARVVPLAAAFFFSATLSEASSAICSGAGRILHERGCCDRERSNDRLPHGWGVPLGVNAWENASAACPTAVPLRGREFQTRLSPAPDSLPGRHVPRRVFSARISAARSLRFLDEGDQVLVDQSSALRARFFASLLVDDCQLRLPRRASASCACACDPSSRPGIAVAGFPDAVGNARCFVRGQRPPSLRSTANRGRRIRLKRKRLPSFPSLSSVTVSTGDSFHLQAACTPASGFFFLSRTRLFVSEPWLGYFRKPSQGWTRSWFELVAPCSSAARAPCGFLHRCRLQVCWCHSGLAPPRIDISHCERPCYPPGSSTSTLF